MFSVKKIIYIKNNSNIIININERDSEIKTNDFSMSVDNKLIIRYLDCLYRIIDNWQKEYVDIKVIDGNIWQLTIINSDGSKREYKGKASYPYNFEALEGLNIKLIEEAQYG